AMAQNRPLQLLTVCRLVEKKGVDTLIGAVADVRRSGLACELTVGGDGPDRARLMALAGDRQIADHVRWLGAVDNAAVRDAMAGADLFALPCRSDSNGDRDGIPVVLMEAMACGVP